MSMISAQVDELRAMAESVGLEAPQAATLMMEAADSIPRYEQPMDEPERTPAEWMDLCKHCEACLRLLGAFCYAGEVNRDMAYWEDDAARILGCGECECWED